MAIRPSLVVAVAAFTAAVIVLAADSAWGVRVALEWQDADGAWHALTTEDSDPYAPRPFGGDATVRVPSNGSVDFRVLVTNDRPVALSDPVRVTWESHGPGGARVATPVDDVMDAGAFATEILTFRLSHADLVPADRTDGKDAEFPDQRDGSFFVKVGDRVTVQWIQVVEAS